MPHRTNDFQRLTYLVKHNLAGEAVVTESKMLKDLVSGDDVEVDVCVEGKVGEDGVVVSVECRDRSRKADKNWVHEMQAKHLRLPTNALILASTRGFTKRALELARSYGIQTVTLEELEDADFPRSMHREMSLWAKAYSITVSKVIFELEPSADDPAHRVVVEPLHRIFDSEGTFLGFAKDLAETLMNAEPVRQFFIKEGKPDSRFFDIEWNSKDFPNMHLEKIVTKQLRRIVSVHIFGPIECTVSGMRLRRAKLGTTHVAWGKAIVLGKDTMLVATRAADGTEKISINMARVTRGAVSTKPPSEDAGALTAVGYGIGTGKASPAS